MNHIKTHTATFGEEEWKLIADAVDYYTNVVSNELRKINASDNDWEKVSELEEVQRHLCEINKTKE